MKRIEYPHERLIDFHEACNLYQDTGMMSVLHRQDDATLKSFRELVEKVENDTELNKNSERWYGFEICRRAILSQLPPEQEGE